MAVGRMKKRRSIGIRREKRRQRRGRHSWICAGRQRQYWRGLGQKPAGSRLRPMIAIFLRAACARSAGMTSHFDDQPSAINGTGPSDPLNGLPRGRLRRECTAEKVSAAARLSGLEKAGAGGPLGLPLAKEKRRGGRHAPVPGVRSGCAPYLACGFDHQAQLVALRFHGDVVAVHCAAEAALR